MTSEDLLAFVQTNISTFTRARVVERGIAYHYSSHADAIQRAKRFLGAPISRDLDKTQVTLQSRPATSDPGVVFAYYSAHDAAEEGFDCELFEIHFRSAVAVTHAQEFAIGGPETTLLILNTEIERFERLGPSEAFERV